MGLCSSVANSVHDAEYGIEDDNVVVYEVKGGATPLEEAFRGGSVYSHRGDKGLNQDAAILCQGYGVEGGAFGGVFDGHGKNGHVVSKVVRNRLPSLFLSQRLGLGNIDAKSASNNSVEMNGETSQPSKDFIKWKEACINSFKAMDKEVKQLEKFDCACTGTTAVVAVKHGEDLLIANLGDSRAVLGTRTEDGVSAVQLTSDQKPCVPTEAERIWKCNGRVASLQEEPHIQRVWLPNEDRPGLAMSRAIGDFLLKNHGVTAHPEVSYRRISPEDRFVVLATDGVWDVLSNDEVVSIVCSTNSEEAVARAVVAASIAAWKEKFPNSKRDDSTVICLFLQKRQP